MNLRRGAALPRDGQSQFPLREQLNQQLERRVQQPLVGVLDLTQQEVGESEQDVVTPVGEVHQQTLEGVLGYETQLIVHVDGQPSSPDKDKENILFVRRMKVCGHNVNQENCIFK